MNAQTIVAKLALVFIQRAKIYTPAKSL